MLTRSYYYESNSRYRRQRGTLAGCLYYFYRTFTNALDHGVLGLSSDLKDSPEGFAQYFSERQTRLNQLVDGDIDIYVELYQLKNVGKIVIKIKDSGKGFNISKFINKTSEQSVNKKLSGRGIELVKQLSNSVNYYENGTLVEASFLWEKP